MLGSTPGPSTVVDSCAPVLLDPGGIHGCREDALDAESWFPPATWHRPLGEGVLVTCPLGSTPAGRMSSAHVALFSPATLAYRHGLVGQGGCM